MIHDGVLCRDYTPSPMGDAVTVPIRPIKLHAGALKRNYNVLAIGHQGTETPSDRENTRPLETGYILGWYGWVYGAILQGVSKVSEV